MIDWSRTRAWGEGGYYARIFLNVEGREPEGIVSAHRLADEKDRLSRALLRLNDDLGRPIKAQVVRPEQQYRLVRGCPPDLMVFFDDLGIRSVGSVGDGPIYTKLNDKGPDACNHDWEGIFVMAGGGAPARGAIANVSIYDVAPTVLGLMGLVSPSELVGTDRSIV
jgi:predicted AlkP superfamily phosphohydrolase/phosphomutase